MVNSRISSRSVFLAINMALLALLWIAGARAGTPKIEISEVAVHLLGAHRNDAEVLFQLTNTGEDTITLVGAASPDAESVVIHATIIVGGQKKMRDVDAYNIPPGGTVRMAAGGML